MTRHTDVGSSSISSKIIIVILETTTFIVDGTSAVSMLISIWIISFILIFFWESNSCHVKYRNQNDSRIYVTLYKRQLTFFFFFSFNHPDVASKFYSSSGV